MHVHTHCKEIILARASSLRQEFKKLAGVGTDKMNEQGVIAMAFASADLLAETIANLPEPDRSEWIDNVVSNLAKRVAALRELMEVHPADCPHCAKRRQERANVQ